ncbi:nicotinate-nucleotide--dimethylbenzimidazole phosphoribosyltransferase [Vogesella fluminis]|uniref:Nicotinate-nucleotide--dimethylbenzimidazole phosphoribosyltransferase n=1 Tax=Vogesella fluminis TaxID=1069161 RepID=A0ABQ3HDI1_9NEIS|nr:nicotinate-nucleotide--dimethylbenzimidazole phosphoribosyltransferase [Vogesella fluminis]GHD78846.1 nicotinate-nucleotide--dimethylbenzimidazole phosphoribosyltransferase [Vogesella fluminis]
MSRIPTPDLSALAAAQARQQQLTKPAGSLGQMEDLACRLAALQGREVPLPLTPAITVFAGDHGVCAEGVSAFPQEVTGAMVANFVHGGAAISVLARVNQARLEVVDAGVAASLDGLPIVHAKVRAGSGNIRREAAMSAAEVQQALDVGRNAARRAIASGATLLIAGDMGIGNTTPSAALICRLGKYSPEAIVGRGTGIDDAGLALKRQVVADALARVAAGLDGCGVLAELGGLEIAAMAGFYLEGAAQGVPLLLDGFISTAAALAAQAIDPAITPWFIASHCSQETGHQLALAALGLTPLIDLGFRLGEGSGAAAAIPLLQQAIALHAGMATFAEAGVAGKN